MKKIIFTIIACLCVSAAVYLIYLNEVVLPQKIRTVLVEGLQRATGKNVTVGSAKLDIFRGLVIKDLAISDERSVILSSKDVSCRFLIASVLKKEIIITALKLDSPQVFVERLPDNSINIIELFFKKPILLMGGKPTLAVSRVIISKGNITLKDDMLNPPFTKEIKNANIDIKLRLPDNIGFNADFEIPSKVTTLIRSSGEYSILKKAFSAKIEAKDLYLMNFARYCEGKNFDLPDGRIDAYVKMDLGGNIFNADIDMSGMDLIFFKDKIRASLNGALKARIKYDFSKKEIICRGQMAVKNLSLSSLDFIGNIYDIRGRLDFSDKSLSFEDITATVLGVPVRAKADLKDLANPVLKIDVNSEVELSVLKNILKDKFSVNIPAQITGEGKLNIVIQYKLPVTEQPVLSGSLDINGVTLRSEYSKIPFEGLTGKIDFTQNQAIWQALYFKFKGTQYKTSGVATNFEKPGIQFELASNKLSVKSLIAINNKTVTVSSLAGRYGDYEFSIQGDIDTTDPEKSGADINGTIKFVLAENKEPYKSFKDKFKDLRPSGSLTAQFSLKGYLNDVIHSSIDAEVKSDDLSLYGFNMDSFNMTLAHRNGIMNIRRINSHLYDATIDGDGLIDLVSKDTPYQINADIKDARIEEFKKDTAFKDKDISGTIQAHVGVKGFLNDLGALNAWGKISILNGKLWQLNLFRGIGTLLFKSDFSVVVFKEGSCSFVIKDKTIFTNDLIMKSDLLDLNGAVRLGFDNSVSASLKAEFTDEGIDAANVSNIAGAIERYSIIEVKGTLKEPKYRFRPDLSNIAGDIADRFFQQ